VEIDHDSDVDGNFSAKSKGEKNDRPKIDSIEEIKIGSAKDLGPNSLHSLED